MTKNKTESYLKNKAKLLIFKMNNAYLFLANVAVFIAHLKAGVLSSAALLVHLQAALLAGILNMVRVILDVTLSGATVTTRHLDVTVTGTYLDAACSSS